MSTSTASAERDLAKMAASTASADVAASADRVLDKIVAINRTLPFITECGEEFNHCMSNPEITTLIINGATGSGKTTGAITEIYKLKKKFILTAPTIELVQNLKRRLIGAYGIPKHDIGTACGGVHLYDESTPIILATYKTLSNQLINGSFDPERIIIMDEAHINDEFGIELRGLLINFLEEGKLSKVLFLSATFNLELFNTYTKKLKPVVLTSSGRTYPIEFHHELKPIELSSQQDIIEYTIHKLEQLIMATASSASTVESSGNILVFVDGEGSIYELIKILKDLGYDTKYDIFGLHSRLPHPSMDKLSGKPIICIATNVAQQGITFEWPVNIVIDACVKKTKKSGKFTKYIIVDTSRSDSQQRAGRTGRICPGRYYCRFTEEQYSSIVADTPATISDEIVLNLLVNGIDPDEILKVDLSANYQSLIEKELILSTNEPTEYGKSINHFNCIGDLKYARICTDICAYRRGSRILAAIIVAMITTLEQSKCTSYFYMKPGDKLVELPAFAEFGRDTDLYTLIVIFRAAKDAYDEYYLYEWCHENGINFQPLEKAYATFYRLLNRFEIEPELFCDMCRKCSPSDIKLMIKDVYEVCSKVSIYIDRCSTELADGTVVKCYSDNATSGVELKKYAKYCALSGRTNTKGMHLCSFIF